MSDIENSTKDRLFGNISFVKEVAKYFMDFLETDFHKQRVPKRNIQLRSNDNLLVGLNLSKYQNFTDIVWKAINHNFDKNIISTISKGVYKTPIPDNLLDLVKLQIKRITAKQTTKVIREISREIENHAVFYKKEYDQAFDMSLGSASKILKSNLIVPLVNNLEKPLENMSLGDENDVYLMEEELTSVLLRMLENKISEILKFLLSGEKVDISVELANIFQLEDVKLSISSFFENYKVGDLFSELYEIERNRTILDNQEFYLYFCDITFNKVKYPLFYIPISLVKSSSESLNLEFDSQVYINKKAIEYVIQECSKDERVKGGIQSITERIIYLAAHENDFRELITNILNEISHFFDLDNSIDISNPDLQVGKSLLVRVSNATYVQLFDKSDEALVNDYEEIIELLSSENNVLAQAFSILIDNFIHKDPKTVNSLIEAEWDDMETPDRLVFESPIPLNSEQRQILSAIKNDDCKYIIVEGPPGTGKSHTITSIVFDSILNNKSVLVLSDKKEALDVVEDKITNTMNKVRHDKNFQNPILRLGKVGNTYSQILATSAVDSIKTHYRAVRKDYDELESSLSKIGNSLKDDLQAEILAYKNIYLKEIEEFTFLESFYDNHDFPVQLDEVFEREESPIELVDIRNACLSLKRRFSPDLEDQIQLTLLKLLDFSTNSFKRPKDFYEYVNLLNFLSLSIAKIKDTYKRDLDFFSKIESFSKRDLLNLKQFIVRFEKEKTFLVGYLFKKEKMKELDRDFNKNFSFLDFSIPHQNLNLLKTVVDIFDYALELKEQFKKPEDISFDYLGFLLEAIKKGQIIEALAILADSQSDLKFLESNFSKYPKTLEKVELKQQLFKTFYNNKLTNTEDLEFNKFIRYIGLKQKITKDFLSVPVFDYAFQEKTIEELATIQMTYSLDGRLINFYDNSKNVAKTLREIIRSKQRFPKNEFAQLKSAFPCILAGIRDYAEYIPLEPGIFDLLIIDEASQVSIAQAFPALLRAKKVLILGDRKQFSNIKTAQARTTTNREYLNNLKDVFLKHVSKETSDLVKLEKFNIKTSILEFFEFISNYNTQLLKHFRGYKEIISYSNKYFYQDKLQVMKIRGKSIDDVLKFTVLKHDNAKEELPNTNLTEIEFVVDQLKELKKQDSVVSVGIITPHTNQQKLFVEKINLLPEKDYFYNDLKLKIMTFDTCQGEERDLIFYSMVATKSNDHLWGIFIKDLSSVDIEEDGKIKAQRLNVGLSRAKESMHFVLSKDADRFDGSIGEALRHYKFVLEEAKKERSILEVDQKSQMEPEVMSWFYQTEFWKKNKDHVEFIPQFELGKYLKQLDSFYDHPNYVVDFLLVYEDDRQKEYKIIIEYDGFREHFKDIEGVNKSNYQNYYSDEDIYREKILEGYGYRFLRINRFNSGKNPIETLNRRIEDLIKDTPPCRLINNIQETVNNIENGKFKECPKCKELRDVDDFKDRLLITGYGRFCKFCKGRSFDGQSRIALTQEADSSRNGRNCPICGSRMTLRSGRYGKFYGCSRFPYCRGTRPYKTN